jgi:hypothetical protein
MSLTIEMVVLFLMRIGIPILLLIILGTVIERWQRACEERSDCQDLVDDQQRSAT